MAIHVCEALEINCIDFRFRKYIRKWNETHFTDSDYDMVAIAGASKDLYIIMKQLEVATRLHHITRIIIMHHEDCGAYAKNSTKENHIKDMKKAQHTIAILYPEIKVKLFYLHLDGKFEKIA